MKTVSTKRSSLPPNRSFLAQGGSSPKRSLRRQREMNMNRDNPQPTDFVKGDRVRVVDSCTAPSLLNHVGTVGPPNAKYQFRVAVQFYIDRDFRELFFHPSELELLKDKPSQDERGRQDNS